MTIKRDQFGDPVQAARPATVQNVAIGGSSAQSTTFQTGDPGYTYNADGTVNQNVQNFTQHIRVVATSNCWISFGTNPTAAVGGTSGSILIPAYTPEYFWVVKGERIAVIQDSSAGTLNVAECQQ